MLDVQLNGESCNAHESRNNLHSNKKEQKRTIFKRSKKSKRETESASLSKQVPSISVPVRVSDCNWGRGEKSTLITSPVRSGSEANLLILPLRT